MFFSSCEEEATLEGASEIYITIDPMNITLAIGDTVNISAKVTNLGGAVIDTPIEWSIEDESVAALLGDTAVIAVNGGQGKETRLKAKLLNGKYALTTVSVSRNLPDGVTCVANDSTLTEMVSKRSYNTAHDSVMFAISPKTLLYDYTPVVTLEGVTALDPEITVDTVKGIVKVHFSTPRSYGEGLVTLSMGDASTAKSASCKIAIEPELFATFYGEDYANMPYLGTRPGKDVLPMYFAYTYSTLMDVNSEKEVRLAVNLQSGAREDIENGYKAYRWEVISGGSVVISEKINEFVENEGFDAVLKVRSGVEEGVTEIHCITPDTVFVATFEVQDLKNRYPVDEITVSHDPISLPMGATLLLTTGVIPETSYAYHKPVVTAADPAKIQVGVYDGNVIPITALELGETELILTSNGKEKRVHVTITEGIKSVLWVSGNARTLFEGQSVQWGIDAKTLSGADNPYDVTWISSNTDVLTAQQTGDDNKHGTITAVSVGTAEVRAEVAGVSSETADVKVIALPDNFELTASNTEKDNSAVYDEGDDLVVIISSTSGYSQIMLTLPGAFNGSDYDGDYTVPGGTVVSVDGASAEVTSGNLSVETAGGQTLVNFNITGTVGERTFSINATDVPVSL